MSIKNRLLLSFIAVAIFVMTIFGYVAYRTSIESEFNREIELSRVFLKNEAILLSSRITDHQSLERVRSEVSIHKYSTHHLYFLFDEKNDFTVSTSLPKFLGERYRQFPIKELVRADERNGSFNFEGDEFIWARAAIRGLPYKVIVIRRLQKKIPSFIQKQKTRLVLTGIVVLWIATWGALILTAFITKRLDRQNAALVHQAHHDELTGLPNRTLLYERLEKLLQYDNKDGCRGALLVMDLDHFKDINDTLGHISGDLLLLRIGARIQGMITDQDTVARLGGDEFAILLPGANAEQALQHARNIIELLAKPFLMDNLYLDVETSIGIALYPDHGKNPDSLIRRADIAMYQAKGKGSGYVIYKEEADPYSIHRLSLLGELHHAIGRDELMLYYQPKVDLRNGCTLEVEALLRWNHPQFGMVQPDEFIPLAEHTGLIRPLTLWVFNTALRQNHIWRQAGKNLNIAVNLSARNLQESELPNQIRELLEAWGTPANTLMVEITESALMTDPVHARRILMDINEIGVGISIDDFGTGYSSMVSLIQLPLSEIKIDRSFVMDMQKNKKNAVIVRSTIDLAHSLERIVTAEGVEDRETLEALESLGCDKAQGYFMSRPLPANELIEWLMESEWGTCKQSL